MYRQEISIPINKDKRNFEDRRKEMFNSLERQCSSSHSTSRRNEDLWDMEVKEWVSNSKTDWDREIEKIRNGLFRLEPLDSDSFMSGFGDNSSSSTTVSKSMKTTTTITSDGKTTTESSESHHTSSSGGNDNINMGNRPIMANTNLRNNQLTTTSDTLTNTDFLKDAFELSDDQKVHFKIRLETTDFNPEDIKVVAIGNKVTVKAKKELKQGNTSSFREFSRTITVPPSVDSTKFQCLQTQDGILILEAPLKQEDHRAISVKEGHVGVRAVSDQNSTFSNSLVTVTGKSGPIVVDDATFGKKVHLEIPVDADYEPSDFTVYVDLNKIHIKGRHVVKTANSSSSKEFSRYYEVPETLDPMSVSFHLIQSTLIVEAPLIRSV